MADKTTDKPEAPTRSGLDPELRAIARIHRILADLPPEMGVRILGYLMNKTSARYEPEPKDPYKGNW